ncbi:MAG TPA: response regulator, partial [Vineibacter sp.]|nr:response regulator [Vineibacter sp.]
EIVEEMGGFLRRRGHDVVTAQNVATAVAALDAAGPFDTVLTDLRMPGAGGLDIVQACRLRPRPRPTVVVMSGLAGPRETAAALDAGAAWVLSKPVKPRDLLTLLAEIEAGRAAERFPHHPHLALGATAA